jgi:hypothetical protein
MRYLDERGAVGIRLWRLGRRPYGNTEEIPPDAAARADAAGADNRPAAVLTLHAASGEMGIISVLPDGCQKLLFALLNGTNRS